jgi:methylated-DNA-protein-cysteine methyltransferase related protein
VSATRRLTEARRFRVAVYALVRRVPRGQVVTYGQVAAMVRRPRSARAVGGAMRQCPDGVPWHRVVNAQGGISRRRQSSGMLTQRIRLEQEGVKLRGGRVPLSRYQWQPPRGAVNGLRGPREWGVMGGPGRPPHR